MATGTLARSRVYRNWDAPELTVRTQDGSSVELSIDGEVETDDDGTIVLRKHRRPLHVYRPDRQART